MSWKLGEKGKNLITTKVIEGQLYARCDIHEDGTEIWLQVIPLEDDKCPLCGYSGYSLDTHHIHGRKFSDETIEICANCHREVHAGIRSIP